SRCQVSAASSISNRAMAYSSVSTSAATAAAASAPRKSAAIRQTRSRPLDKGVHDLLVAGMLEIDRELVVLDLADHAVAEFLMEDAVADREAADFRHLLAASRNPGAFDQHRRARRRVEHAVAAAGIGGVPARAPRRRAGPVADAAQPRLGLYLDMRGRQLVDKPRPRRALPLPVDAAVGGERNLRPMPRPGQPDIGETPLLLEAGKAVLVHRALARKQPFLPAGQEHRVEFEALGAVQRHQADHVAA